MEHELQEIETWVEQYKQNQRADLHNLRRELKHLEEDRSELTAKVSADNTDQGSQVAMEKNDEQIEDVKLQIMVLQREVRSTLMSKRQELSEKLNGHIESLKAEIAEMRNEQETIRSKTVPNLEREIEELRDRSTTIDGQLRRKAEMINKLSEHSGDALDLEFD